MTDQPNLATSKLSRRSLLKNVPILAGAVASAAAMAQAALAQTKLSHDVAKYQDQPKNGQKCLTCLQFVPPGSCKIVVDPISPNGWCQFYGPITT
jgi:hypothetical protein